MQRSQLDNQSWSFHISGNDTFNNLWPELCQKHTVKPPAQETELASIGESNKIIMLDDLEYPELDSAAVLPRNKYLFTPRKEFLESPTLRVIIPTYSNMEPRKSKTVRKFKRTDKICINLQEILENTRRINKATNKDLPRLRINIYRRNSGIAANPIDKQSKVQKVRILLSKDRKPSKLKRIILLKRDLRAQANVERREAFEQQKVEAICKDVDDINFSALKITTDPQIDYVKSMCTMTLYGKDYRNPQEENISETSVYYRPDIIGKINNLCIQGKQISNQLPIGNCQYPVKHDNAIEDDIIERTLSLEIKEDIKQEYDDELDTKNFLIYSRNFREYCTNMLTPGLNDSLETFLKEIMRLQKRLHEKNSQKSKYKRRYYSGLKEVRKHVELRKIKFVIIAPDIEKVDLEGGLDNEVTKLIDVCQNHNVVYCFGLRRRKLGYYTHGKGFVGCVGIANYSGTEELFQNVLTEVVHARNAFKKLNGAKDSIIDISKLISDEYLLSENINTLLKIVCSTNICI